MASLWIKTCGESEYDNFEVKNAFSIQEKPDIDSFLGKIAIFSTFRFNTQAFPESGKRFLLRRCKIRIPRMLLLLEVSFQEKIYDNFLMWVAPYCVVAPNSIFREAHIIPQLPTTSNVLFDPLGQKNRPKVFPAPSFKAAMTNSESQPIITAPRTGMF
jgi:hypothetical protein